MGNLCGHARNTPQTDLRGTIARGIAADEQVKCFLSDGNVKRNPNPNPPEVPIEVDPELCEIMNGLKEELFDPSAHPTHHTGVAHNQNRQSAPPPP